MVDFCGKCGYIYQVPWILWALIQTKSTNLGFFFNSYKSFRGNQADCFFSDLRLDLQNDGPWKRYELLSKDDLFGTYKNNFSNFCCIFIHSQSLVTFKT